MLLEGEKYYGGTYYKWEWGQKMLGSQKDLNERVAFRQKMNIWQKQTFGQNAFQMKDQQMNK